MERGVQIGADVPYCVMRGTALAEGIGEKLTSLPGVPMCYVLIGKPGINVSTKFVYGNLHLDEVTDHLISMAWYRRSGITICTASRTAWEMCWNP